MSRFLQPDNGVVQSYEIVDKAVAEMKLFAAFATALGSADNIYANETPLDNPDEGRWITVFERISVGGRIEQPHGLERIVLMVQTECVRTIRMPRAWHDATQNEVSNFMLTTFDPTFDYADIAVPISRGKVFSPRIDKDRNTFVATSEFTLVLAPKA